MQGHIEIVQLLITFGADKDLAMGDSEMTAVKWASVRKFHNIVELLLESGARHWWPQPARKGRRGRGRK